MDRNTYLLMKKQADTIRRLSARIRRLEHREKSPLYTTRWMMEGIDQVALSNFASPYGSHFDYGPYFDTPDDVSPPDMSWAGAPFATPSGVSVMWSYFKLVMDSVVAGGRAFLYRDLDASALFNMYGIFNAVGNFAAVTQVYVGHRLDDGTDNNYVETVLCSEADGSGFPVSRFYQRHRTGGGAVTTSQRSISFMPYPYVLRASIEGTRWTNWAMTPVFYSYGARIKPVGVTGRAWTPSRQGIIFDTNGHSGGWEYFTVDAWGSTDTG